MTAIESKEEISDTDSGIIVHSGKNITAKHGIRFQRTSSYSLGHHGHEQCARDKVACHIAVLIVILEQLKLCFLDTLTDDCDIINKTISFHG